MTLYPFCFYSSYHKFCVLSHFTGRKSSDRSQIQGVPAGAILGGRLRGVRASVPEPPAGLRGQLRAPAQRLPHLRLARQGDVFHAAGRLRRNAGELRCLPLKPLCGDCLIIKPGPLCSHGTCFGISYIEKKTKLYHFASLPSVCSRPFFSQKPGDIELNTVIISNLLTYCTELQFATKISFRNRYILNTKFST